MKKNIIDYTINEILNLTFEQWKALSKEELDYLEEKSSIIISAAKSIKSQSN